MAAEEPPSAQPRGIGLRLGRSNTLCARNTAPEPDSLLRRRPRIPLPMTRSYRRAFSRALITLPLLAAVPLTASSAEAAPLSAPTQVSAVSAPAPVIRVVARPLVSVSSIGAYRLSARTVRNISAAHKWAAGQIPRAIRARESGGNYRINTGNGYYGAYQFDYGSWLANGGGRFAPTANKAPAWAQDYVAWTYWRKAGYGPWGGGA